MYKAIYDLSFKDMEDIFNYISKILACQFGFADRTRVLRRELLVGKIHNIPEDFFDEYESLEYSYITTINNVKIVICETNCKLLPYKDHMKVKNFLALCNEDQTTKLIKIPNVTDYDDKSLFEIIKWIYSRIFSQFSEVEIYKRLPDDTLQIPHIFAEMTGLMSVNWVNEEFPEVQKIAQKMADSCIVVSNGSYTTMNISTYEKQKLFLKIFKDGINKIYVE